MNYTFYGLVTEVKRQVLSTDNNVVMTVASIVAAIFACFAIVSITKEIVLEQSGNNWKVWRPLAILVILPMFNNIVLFVDDITTNIADAIWNGVSNDKDNYDAMYASMLAKVESITSSDDWMGSLQNALSSSVSVEGLTGDSNVAGEAYADNASNSNDEVPWYKAIWNRITGWASEVQGFVIKSTGNLLSFIVSFMMNCVRYILVGASGVYLMVIGILGPLVLAISLIPTFENSIWQWVARYIQVSMWIPLTSIVDFVNCKMRVAMIGTFNQCNTETMMTFPIHQLLLNIIMLGMLFAVPSMANWIIQSTGASNVYRGLAQRAGAVAVKVASKL